MERIKLNILRQKDQWSDIDTYIFDIFKTGRV